MAQSKNLKFHTYGFEIKASKDESIKPLSFKLWDTSEHLPQEHTPTAPLKYLNDALTAIHFHKLTGYSQCSAQDVQSLNHFIKEFCPYHYLYQTSWQRLSQWPSVEAGSSTQPTSLTSGEKKIWQQFEKDCLKFFESLNNLKKIDFTQFNSLIQWIDQLESHLGSNLLYNSRFKMSEELTEKFLSLYSFLFHVRSLFALQHNSLVQDSSFEAVKCDSIQDYLPKADFTTNDALVYWQFKKLSTPFVAHKDKDIRIEKLLVDPLQRAFEQFNHNACTLVNHLPKQLLENTPQADLEETFYQWQMDWLLGSSAGLLFRLREELFAATRGYNEFFWPEAKNTFKGHHDSLRFCFELDHEFFGRKVA